MGRTRPVPEVAERRLPSPLLTTPRALLVLSCFAAASTWLGCSSGKTAHGWQVKLRDARWEATLPVQAASGGTPAPASADTGFVVVELDMSRAGGASPLAHGDVELVSANGPRYRPVAYSLDGGPFLAGSFEGPAKPSKVQLAFAVPNVRKRERFSLSLKNVDLGGLPGVA